MESARQLPVAGFCNPLNQTITLLILMKNMPLLRNPLFNPVALAMFLLSLFIVPEVGADVIYRQNFGNNLEGTGSGSRLSLYDPNINWNILFSRNTVPEVTEGSSVNTGNIGVINGTGRPTNLSNVNAPASLSNSQGLVTVRNGATTFYTALIYTSHYPIDQSLYSIESIQWYAGGSAGGSTLRAALQIDGDWYVSDAVSVQIIIDSGTSFSTSARRDTIDFNTTSWYQLEAEIGSPFAISSTASDLSGSIIEAFGVYATPSQANPSTFLRFDTFTVNASLIPEPETLALFFGIAGIALYGWRRRQKRLGV